MAIIAYRAMAGKLTLTFHALIHRRNVLWYCPVNHTFNFAPAASALLRKLPGQIYPLHMGMMYIPDAPPGVAQMKVHHVLYRIPRF